jgi:hypothetical protein
LISFDCFYIQKKRKKAQKKKRKCIPLPFVDQIQGWFSNGKIFVLFFSDSSPKRKPQRLGIGFERALAFSGRMARLTFFCLLFALFFVETKNILVVALAKGKFRTATRWKDDLAVGGKRLPK